LHYSNRANQRMGQARSQMRRRQAERAFRRAKDQESGDAEPLDLNDHTKMAVRMSRRLQQENIHRADRIAKLVEEGLAALPTPPTDEEDTSSDPSDPSGPNDPAAQQVAAQRQQLELAKHFLALAKEEMQSACQSLEGAASLSKEPATEAPPAGDNVDPDESGPTAEVDHEALSTARDHVANAVEHLQSLRRLFYSIIEHLRETAQRQAGLNDETEQVAALKDDEDAVAKTAPLALRQQQLRSVTGEIAKALDEQAKQAPPAGAESQGLDPQQIEQLQQVSEQMANAAKLVSEGGAQMERAGESLAAEPSELDAARKTRDEALKKLVEALALLTPPQPQQQNQSNQQPGEGQQSERDKQDQEQAAQAGVDPARLLQAVRDREAQRRRDRERRQRFQQEPVDKDW